MIDHHDVARRIFAMGRLSLAARARALGTDRPTLDRIVCGFGASEATYRQLLPRLEALEAAYREVVSANGCDLAEGELEAYRRRRRERREAANERFKAGVCAKLDARCGRR